jgi:hypothetical protein
MELSNLQKVTVLNFDETKVHSNYEFDKIRDEIIGPQSNAGCNGKRTFFKLEATSVCRFRSKSDPNILSI